MTRSHVRHDLFKCCDFRRCTSSNLGNSLGYARDVKVGGQQEVLVLVGGSFYGPICCTVHIVAVVAECSTMCKLLHSAATMRTDLVAALSWLSRCTIKTAYRCDDNSAG